FICIHTSSLDKRLQAMRKVHLRMLVAALLLCGSNWRPGSVPAADWPMLGRDGTRNAVSPERGAPILWSAEARGINRLTDKSRGVRWTARLGWQTFSSPVVANGLVWIGTSQVGNRWAGVLKCFRAADGRQAYEFTAPKLANRIQDPEWTGLGS